MQTAFSHHASRVREILRDNLPWSQFDFIRNISTAGDKELQIEKLTEDIGERNDLRFIHKLPGNDELAVFAEKLLWDTHFFGFGIGKLSGIFPLKAPFFRPSADYTDALRALIEKARQHDIRYLLAFVDPRDLATLRALGALGFCLIETRAYYHMDIRGYDYAERYRVRKAVPEDVEALGNAAREMVNLYDRFHADPFITSVDADRLMYKWVEASICDKFADVTIVPDAVKPTAFCTVRYHKDKWPKWKLKLAQPVFSAVSLEYRGWYRKIISEINYHLRDMGAEHSFLATQITNNPVIWVWESLGYRFGKGEYIFRLVL